LHIYLHSLLHAIPLSILNNAYIISSLGEERYLKYIVQLKRRWEGGEFESWEVICFLRKEKMLLDGVG
jgi:hypothetical protein